ncbi:hypothetical protein KJ969_01610 [Patescibacteria group bacterium]|nr:hypothetical protein [Patescibacteria group bacterium]
MQKRARTILIIGFGLIFFVSFLIFVNQAFAIDVGLAQVAEEIGLGGGDIRVVVARIIRSFLTLLGITAVVLILYGGFVWMTAGGDEEKVEKAKKILINAVIGLAIILTSFAITQFVLNSLLEATGVGPGGPGGGGGPGVGGSGARVFQVKSMSPQGAIPIRNVTVRILFNASVDPTTAEKNISVSRASDGAEVSGDYAVSGAKVSFVPDASCPEPNQDRKCFDADTEYNIKIFEGVRSSSGMFISCSGFGAICEGLFTTGNLVDVQGPSVSITYPDSGQGVPVNSFIALQAYAEDDAGVSLVDFEIDNELIGSDGPPAPTPTSFTAQAEWETSGYVLGSRHEIRARAYDIDDNDTLSGAVGVIIRAEHCFNGAQDAGETGIDCGGVSPDDPDWCGACSGQSCSGNEDCAFGYCEDGVCVSLPIIESVDPLDGAFGTFVTIGGQYFGARVGTVRFLGISAEGDEMSAELASCDGAWSNDQIIITVPQGAVSGPIEVGTADAELDLTNDARGPVIADFWVNAVSRPGICRILPDEGEVGITVDISGVGFGEEPDQVLFGEIEAGRIASWHDGEISAVVPPLAAGDYATRVSVDGNFSNGVNFEVVEAGLAGQPIIVEIDPSDGPVGEYVTLRGSNFGSSVGRVTLTNSSTGQSALASFDFPEDCGDDFWFRDNITFKVPREYNDGESLSLGIHEVRVTRSDGRMSEPVDFTVNNDSLSPGICRLFPNVGPAGTGVTIFGERLGTSPGIVTFYNSKLAEIIAWADKEILTEAPLEAETGPVTAASAEDALSNGLNFKVENCLEEPGACEVDQQCCADGSCVGLDEECAIAPSQPSFVWRFSTGIIPITPQVVESCMAEDLPASPSPWSERSGGEDVCVNAVATVRFNAPMDTSRFTTDNIQIKKCVGLDEEPCAATVDAAVSGIDAINDNRGFQLRTTNFDTASWYEVKLSTRLRGDDSVGGLEMEERAEECGEGYAYCFRWKTSESSDLCTLGDVAVQPGYKIARDFSPVDYNAAAIAGEDICLAIDASSYDWVWSSSDILKAQVSVPDGESPHLAQAQPISETRGEPAEIAAQTAGLRDAGLLEIDFTDPAVLEYEPNCLDACLNANIYVRFNTLMDSASILEPGNIQLLKCDNENCRYFSGANLVTNINASGQDPETWQEIEISHPDFEPREYYRVILSDEIKSYTLTNLTELNYGDNFSWTFRTKEALCMIDHVELRPTLGIVQSQGERQAFRAIAYGEADECSTRGQVLDGSEYDWGWSVDDSLVARLLGGGAVDTSSDSVSAWCNKELCLHLGSVTNIAVCGNGVVEASLGEECDDSNILDGDGCSGRCLIEPVKQVVDDGTCGNADVENESYLSPWRNPWIEGVEECDDGNDLNGDGCSRGCQNEGSTLGGSICGNSSLGDGEDCDDGNRRSGDGCSAECLLEGSNPGPMAICGNGTAEIRLGEDCDDGRDCSDGSICLSNIDCAGIGDEQCRPRSGDGCSEKCLNEGTYPCLGLTDLGCCGNGIRETGEDCDGQEGCGLACLNLGSSYFYTAASYCGDGIVGIGEEAGCEIGTGDGRGDALQVAEAVGAGAVDEDGLQSTLVRATAETVIGEATFGLECGFIFDAECKAIDPGLGLAENSCCYSMPRVQSIIPPGDANDICLNARIEITFNEPIDQVSIRYEEGGEMKDRILLIAGQTEECAGDEMDYKISYAPDDGLSWWQRAWRGIKRFFSRLVAGLAWAKADDTIDWRGLHYCGRSGLVAGDVRISGQTASYKIKQVLDANTWYQIRILPGLKSARGVALDEYYASFFGTGTEICKLDYVEIKDPSDYFFFNTAREGEVYGQRSFTAHAMSRRAGLSPQAIEEIAGLYEWEWGWSSSAADDSGDNIVSVEPGDRTESMIAPAGLNGQEAVSAQAKITLDNMFGRACERDSDCARNLCVIPEGEETGRCAGEVVSDSASVTVLLCENPWMEFSDPDIWHFASMYCRDNVPNLLPELAVVEVATPPESVPKEYLLTYADAPAGAAWARDAIGLRIMANPEHLSPEEWYAAQGFGGAPQSMEVDGYAAVQYGTSTYVGAANKVGDPIYTNIYILSHSEGANEITVNIYNQFLENFVFNYDNVTNERVCRDRFGEYLALVDEPGKLISCTHDLECSAHEDGAHCDADKDKLTRDVKRIADFGQLAKSLDTYRLITGGKRTCVKDGVDTGISCESDAVCKLIDETTECKVVGGSVPSLESGSYLRAYTTSLWPSWQSVLGNALGESVAVDPVNQFAGCGNGYDASTCFDSDALEAMCPRGSLVYQYHSIGAENYQINAQLEFENLWDPFSFDEHIGFERDWCDNTIFSNNDLCGDGLHGPDEICELGETKLESRGCSGDERRQVGCVADGPSCRWATRGDAEYGECVLRAPACGNGVREGFCVGGDYDALLCQNDYDCPEGVCSLKLGEVCDDGANNGKYGHCNLDCTGSGAYCGDGVLAGAEQCDLEDENGQYASGCSWDCRAPGPMCGDAIIQSEEQCEEGDFEEMTSGICRDTAEVQCAANGDCPGYRKAGNYCSISREACVPGDRKACGDFGGTCESYDTKNPCLTVCGTDPDTGYELKRVRTCDPGVCEWGAWGACVTDNICGNGMREGAEECDDGNTDNADGCVIVPGREGDLNVSCKIAYCDDGYRYAGIESCDAGSANGMPCTPRYGESCTYCTHTCNWATVTGSYCGDSTLNAGEECDEGPVACWYQHPNLWSGVGKYNPFTGPEPCNPYEEHACPILFKCERCLLGVSTECTQGTCDEYAGVCQGQGISLAHTPAIPPEAPLDYGYNAEYCDSTCHIARREGPRCGDGIVQSRPYPPLPWDYPETSYESCDPNRKSCPGDQICQLGKGGKYYCFVGAGEGSVIESTGEVCDSGASNGEYGATAANCNATCTALAPYCGDGKTDTGRGEKCDWGFADYNKKVDLVIISSASSKCHTYDSVKGVCDNINGIIGEFSGLYGYDIEKTFYLINEEYKKVLDADKTLFGECVDNIINGQGELELTASDGSVIKSYTGLTPRHSDEMCDAAYGLAGNLGNCSNGLFTPASGSPKWNNAFVDVAANHVWREGSLKLILALDNTVPFWDAFSGQWLRSSQVWFTLMNNFYGAEFANLEEKPRLIIAYDNRETGDETGDDCITHADNVKTQDGLDSIYYFQSPGNWVGRGSAILDYSYAWGGDDTSVENMLRNVFRSIFCDIDNDGDTDCSCLAATCL